MALLIIFTPSNTNLNVQSESAKSRVLGVNEYFFDLKNVYLERTLHATGIKTINALTEYVAANGAFTGINPGEAELAFNSTFSKVFLCGKVDDVTNGPVNIADCSGGTPIDLIYDPPNSKPDIMTKTYNDWLDEIRTTALNAYNVQTDLTIYGIQVYQDEEIKPGYGTNPWVVNVDANISISVYSETASWSENTKVKTKIEIKNFNDPYYLMNTQATGNPYYSKMSKSDTLIDAWNVGELGAFIRQGNYTYFGDGKSPSFLMRFIDNQFWYDAANDGKRLCCGIEGFVNPNEILPASDRDVAVSYIDYLFWRDTPDCDSIPPFVNLYLVEGLSNEPPPGPPGEFRYLKLNDDQVARYMIPPSELIQVCPT